MEVVVVAQTDKHNNSSSTTIKISPRKVVGVALLVEEVVVVAEADQCPGEEEEGERCCPTRGSSSLAVYPLRQLTRIYVRCLRVRELFWTCV
jgi:hypothetical protein